MSLQTRPAGGVSERVARLKEAMLTRAPRLSSERLRLLLESYRETEGEPPVIRRAMALDKVLAGMTIFIDDNPIVGTLTQYPSGVQPYPEFACKWMEEEASFSGPFGEIQLTAGDRELLKASVDYWRDRCITARVDKVWSERYPNGPSLSDLAPVFTATQTPGARICINYRELLRVGLDGLIEEASAAIAALPLGSLEALRKRSFLRAVVISCRAIIRSAGRYAELAEKMAQNEANETRKLELEKIAAACRQVPAGPPRTFFEAVQSFWLVYVSCLIGNLAGGFTPGRFPQYMHPFYKRDRDAGRTTDDEVLELIEALFIKFSEVSRFERHHVNAVTQGTMFQNISLGGLTADGEDATNDLDFLLIEAQKRVRTIQPTLSVLCHGKTSPELLLKAAELVATGIGMPAFFNANLNVQRLVDHGATLEDARNHCIIGCIEAGFSGSASIMRSGFINMPKLLEIALHNGVDPVTGRRIGLATGAAREFKTYDQLHDAVRKQMQYFLSLYQEWRYLGEALNAELIPLPFISALVDDCIKNGKDMLDGGARYYMDGASPVGVVDLSDSLTAIRKVVFEERRMTMETLLEALSVNFDGKEDIRSLLTEAPKYGNDDPYADSMVRGWYDSFYEEHQKTKDYLGKNTRPVAISIVTHVPFGKVCGALPSGRLARLPLTDASVSPEPGRDREGPTAILLSASRAIDTTRYASSQLNMKFHPNSLHDVEGLKKLLSLIRSYLDMGGHHVQFNVVASSTLRDAQLHPDQYRDLIVRVAGFSAFFVLLDPVVQNEIIRRSELKFG